MFSRELYSKLFAEWLGTLALVFFGTGAVAVRHETAALDHTAVAFAFGSIVTILIYSFGKISGAHFNPAVSLAFAFRGKISFPLSFLYMLVQFLGAIAGSLLVSFLFSSSEVGITQPTAGVWRSFFLEFIFTFILMLVIFQVSTGSMEVGILAGAAIGLTVFLLALVGGPFTGASMNPARSFGPAFVSGNFSHLWLYFLAPFLGAVFSLPVCFFLQRTRCED